MEHLLWSGGSNSTAVLLDMLMREGRTVHAHHIHIGAFKGKADAERMAVQCIAPRLYEQCPGLFTYSVCTVDFDNDAALFINDAAGFVEHRAKVLGFVGDIIGARAYQLGRAVPVMYGNYRGVFQYPPKGRVFPALPDALAHLVCDCLKPEITRGQKGAPDSWRQCRKCERCGHAD